MHLISYDDGFRQDGPQVLVGGSGTLCSLSELKTTESSGCFSFCRSDMPNPHLDNRFIVWRALAQDLFLEERCFVEDIVCCSVSLNFVNEVILPGTNLYEAGDFVLLLVATTSAVYRRVYVNPRCQSEIHRRASIFATSSRHERHNTSVCYGSVAEPPHIAATMVGENGEAVFAVASEDGSINVITFSAVGAKFQVSQMTIRHTSRLKQMWHDLWTKAEATISEDCSVSVCFYKQLNEALLCWVSFDQHIRLWSYSQRSLQCDLNLQEALEDLNISNLQLSWVDRCNWRVKTFTVQQEVFVVVFAVLGPTPLFCILKSEYRQKKFCLDLWINFEAEDQNLVDYYLTEKQMFTVWSGKQGLIVKHKHMRVTEAVHQFGWLEAANVDWRIIENESKYDLAQLVEKIFSSEIFSYQTLLKSLRLCCPDANLDCHQVGDRQALRRDALRYVVDRNICTEHDLTTLIFGGSALDAVAVKHRDALRRFFTALWKNCVQYHCIAMKPLGLFSLQMGSLMGVITQEQTIFVSDLKMVLSRFSIPYLGKSLRQNSETALRYSLYLIDKAIRAYQDIFISELINSSHDFCPLRFANKELQTLIQCEQATNAVKFLRKVISGGESLLYNYVYEAVRSIAPERPQHRADFKEVPSLQRHSFDVWASCLRAMFEEKLAFSRALLVLLSMWTKLQSQSQLPTSLWTELMNDIIPKLIVHCRCYGLLRWISTSTLTGCNDNPVNGLILSSCCAYIYNDRQHSDSLLDWLSTLTVDQRDKFPIILPRLIYFALTTFWPEDGCLPVFDCLLELGQFDAIETLGIALEPWCRPARGLRQFYVAFASLQLGHFDRALHYFRQARDEISFGDSMLISKLQLDDVENDKMAVVYCAKVANLFSEAGCLPLSIQCCRDALKLFISQEDRSLILHTIFEYQMRMGDYSDALENLLQDTDRKRSRESLNSFLDLLLKRGLKRTIVDLPFDYMEPFMLNILENQAHLTSALDNPFYPLLYAYFIIRAKYRRAAGYMYEMFLRLNVNDCVDFMKVLRTCRDALVACDSALSIVDRIDAFVVVNIHEESEDRNREKIVHFDEIHMQMLLYQANVQYAEKHNSTKLIEPEVLVSFLVQESRYELATLLCQTLDSGPLLNKFLISVVNQEVEENNSLRVRSTNFQFYKIDWKLTRRYLKQFRDKSATFDLHVSVAHRLLEHGFALPAWMLEDFKSCDCYGLLKFLFEYSLYSEAVQVVEYLIQSADVRVIGDQFPIWLPLLLVDNLAIALETDNSVELNKVELLTRLRLAVDAYYTISKH